MYSHHRSKDSQRSSKFTAHAAVQLQRRHNNSTSSRYDGGQLLEDMGHKESVQLESLVHETFPRCNVDLMHVVNDPQMYGMYLLRKEEMGYSDKELILYHVTTMSRALKSFKNGLDWRRSKFRCGVSFSDDADYANYYADHTTKEENRVIIVCAVLVNKTQRVSGNQNFFVPTGDADTTLSSNGHVYVKYNDYDFYPLYLMYYRRTPEHLNESKYFRNNSLNKCQENNRVVQQQEQQLKQLQELKAQHERHQAERLQQEREQAQRQQVLRAERQREQEWQEARRRVAVQQEQQNNRVMHQQQQKKQQKKQLQELKAQHELHQAERLQQEREQAQRQQVLRAERQREEEWQEARRRVAVQQEQQNNRVMHQQQQKKRQKKQEKQEQKQQQELKTQRERVQAQRGQAQRGQGGLKTRRPVVVEQELCRQEQKLQARHRLEQDQEQLYSRKLTADGSICSVHRHRFCMTNTMYHSCSSIRTSSSALEFTRHAAPRYSERVSPFMHDHIYCDPGRPLLNELNSNAYNDVEQLVKSTFPNCNIDQIRLVHAPQMNGMYMLRHEEMKLTLGQNVQEKMLFHVTTKSRAMESLESGLDWRLAQHTHFGHGVSFSDDADGANYYADKHTTEKTRVIMICNVLVSETYEVPKKINVNSFDQRIPPGRVYVKYNDNEFYPLYFVYYQRKLEHITKSKHFRVNNRQAKNCHDLDAKGYHEDDDYSDLNGVDIYDYLDSKGINDYDYDY